MEKRNILIFLAVSLLGLAVRGAFQAERAFDPNRYDFPAGMDEYNYDRLAAAHAAGRSFFPGEIYALPGYPSLLTTIYRTAGRRPKLVWAFQALLGGLGCGLTFLIGRKLLGPGGGLLAGLIVVFYGPIIFFENRLLPTGPALFFSLLALAWWTYLPKSGHLLSWLVGGFLLGLASIFAPGNLLFALLLILFRIPRERGRGPALFWREVLTVIGILAVLLPYAARNSRRSRGPVLLTAHSGINFYIGNNPEANGGFRTPLFLTPSATGIITDSRREAERRTGRELDAAGVSRFWFREGWLYLTNHPGEELRLLGRKFRLIFSPREYFDLGTEAEAGKAWRLFGLPLLCFGIILPPALLGIFLLCRQRPAGQPFFFYLAAQAAAIIIFFFRGRSRLLMVPALAVPAAGTIIFLWRSLRERRMKRVAAAAILLPFLVLATRSRHRVEMRSETNRLLFRAQKANMEGKATQARKLAEQALTLHPELAGAELVLGSIAADKGDPAAAERHYRKAKEREPYSPEPDLRLCSLYLEQGERQRAREAGQSALAIDPISWRAHSLLADPSREEGENQQLYHHLQRAVELNPNSVRDRKNLAFYFEAAGDVGLAAYHRERAARVGEDDKQ